MLAVLALAGTAEAGDVKSGLVLWVQLPTNNVTFINQGGNAFHGASGETVGGGVTNLPYQDEWGVASGQIRWYDTNNTLTLRMDSAGIDVLNPGGIANSNGHIEGSATLSATSATGLALRNANGLGRTDPFSATIANNSGTLFNVSGCIGIGNPDLWINAKSVDDDTLDPGQTFTVSATVKNQGQGTCQSSTLRYYRSLDNIITTSDTQIASDPIPALDTSATSSQSAVVSAPTMEGPYWIGACVDLIVGEGGGGFHLSNCTSGPVKIRVGPPCDIVTVANQTLDTIVTHQACRELTAGPALDIQTPGPGVRLYGGEAVKLVEGVSVFAAAELTLGSCGHDLCIPSLSPLAPACTPCVETVCATDPDCCSVAWDGGCVLQVETLCRKACP